MPDFGARWQVVDPKPIDKGGQSHACLVRDADGNPEHRYIGRPKSGRELRNAEIPHGPARPRLIRQTSTPDGHGKYWLP
jgi:hypothetical protein